MSHESPSIRPSSPETIAEASRLIRAGKLVAFPTETVYGLGADATNGAAVAALFAAKGRPDFNPLIVHVPDMAGVAELAEVPETAHLVAKRFWPGPLTLVLKRRADCPASLLVSAGLETIAVRVPSHPIAQALLKQAGRPIAAPSANRSGAVSPTRAEHVAESLGERVSLIIDGGPCSVGIESTVLDLSGEAPTLLRPGGVTPEALREVLGALVAGDETPDAPKSPGQLLSHYAPGLPVRLNAASGEAGEALLGFGAAPQATMNLSPSANLEEAAANLFAMLRALDDPAYSGIAVMAIPTEGLGLAINDRLRRAAAPRLATGGARS